MYSILIDLMMRFIHIRSHTHNDSYTSIFVRTIHEWMGLGPNPNRPNSTLNIKTMLLYTSNSWLKMWGPPRNLYFGSKMQILVLGM